MYSNVDQNCLAWLWLWYFTFTHTFLFSSSSFSFSSFFQISESCWGGKCREEKICKFYWFYYNLMWWKIFEKLHSSLPHTVSRLYFFTLKKENKFIKISMFVFYKTWHEGWVNYIRFFIFGLILCLLKHQNQCETLSVSVPSEG